jgi:hypothetical protein
MILSLEGDEATGKTSLAYTAPIKVVGFQFDLGAERALYGAMYDQRFKDLTITTKSYEPGVGWGGQQDIPWQGSDIYIFELPQPIQLDSVEVAGMRELWEYLLVRLGTALRDPQVQSIVIDTMTLARKIKVDAYLQALQEKNRAAGEKPRERLLQIEYGTPNSAIRDIYNTCAGLRKNLIVTHHLQDERVDWIDSSGKKDTRKTGKRILEGLDQTYRYVDVAVRMIKDKGTLVGRLEKCGYNLGLEGTTLSNPTWDGLVDFIEMATGGRLGLPRKVPVGH